MQKITLIVITFVTLVFLSSPVFGQTSSETYFQTPAKYLVILDHDSGEVLFEKNAHVPMAPASMTKIMTASVVFERLKAGTLSMDDEFTVSEKAWRKGGSSMYLEPKMKVSVRDLLRGVIVQSGNDACIVLAEGIAGSEDAFALIMNEQAQKLGLTSAHFKNSTGWPDPEHKISTYDLARLAQHTIEAYPEYYKIYNEKSFRWNKISQPNRNPLFLAKVEGADGLKTGHTEVSKYGFVGSAVRDGKRRIFVVNGLETKTDRKSESVRILRSAFGEFKTYSLYKKGDTISKAKVFMGKAMVVPLTVKSDVNVGMHKLERSKMSVEVKYTSPVPAPITMGDEIGALIVKVSGDVKKTIPLYASEDVERKSAISRAITSLVQKIRGD